MPPLHPRCRCAIIYREIGTPNISDFKRFNNAKDAAEYFGMKAGERATPFGHWESNLTDEERTAIRKYTSSYYTPMNEWLRKQRPSKSFSANELKTLKETIKACETGLAKGILRDDVLFHRQVRLDMLEVYSKARHGIFIDEGFVSTTPVKGSFTGTVDVEIKILAGTEIGAWIAPLSRYVEEYEFLLNRGSKFLIESIDTSGKRPLVKMVYGGREPSIVKDKEELQKREQKESRADRFTWTPADIMVQDENGKWISGAELLRRERAKERKNTKTS